MICTNCLHANVCSEEGSFEEALKYCSEYLGRIPDEMNLSNVIEEEKEVSRALYEFVDKLEQESILIKTMTNLPEHCYDCPCHNGESGYCQADKEYRYSVHRPFWCPLVKISRQDECEVTKN